MAIGTEVNDKLVHMQVADDVPLALGHIEHLNEPEIDLQ